MEGSIEGRRSKGRKKYGMLTDIMRVRSYEEIKNQAQDLESWRRWR